MHHQDIKEYNYSEDALLYPFLIILMSGRHAPSGSWTHNHDHTLHSILYCFSIKIIIITWKDCVDFFSLGMGMLFWESQLSLDNSDQDSHTKLTPESIWETVEGFKLGLDYFNFDIGLLRSYIFDHMLYPTGWKDEGSQLLFAILNKPSCGYIMHLTCSYMKQIIRQI
jgi:hypothetical protein